jgi:AAA15 family ATPase/GTPase
LSVGAIYGANAGGKSNAYQAFEYMTKYVLLSFNFGGEGGEEKKSDYGDSMKQSPFLFDRTSRNASSSFEVFFVDTSDPAIKFYNYGFCLNARGVTEEWLNGKSKTARQYSRVFYRSENELDLSGLPPKARANIAISLEPEALVVSLGAKLKIAKLKLIRNWFMKNVFMDFGNPAENYFLSVKIPKGFEDDERVQEDVLNYFSSFDNSIQGFHVEKIPAKSDKDKEHLRIDAFHRMIDSEETASISLRLESGGTQKMFALYPGLRAVLKNGSVLFVDELNARLHPLLVRNFIQTFLNPQLNPNNAQLIFTTHDTWQLSNDLLRRDEIWFTEKDFDGVSSLYSLADFVDEDGVKIRKDENYEKNYLLGKYGAIPALKSLNMFGE